MGQGALEIRRLGETQWAAAGFRAVPNCVVRRSAFIAPGVVLMPSFVNLGAYVDSGTMVDTWATVGSCAQIGKNVHISGGAGIGGVLEPLQAGPVIIEDNCFVGARSEVAEGVIVREGSVLSMGVFIGASTKIIDRQTGETFIGEVPPYSVVVPGTVPGKEMANGQPGPGLYCAVIVKRLTSAPARKPRSTSFYVTKQQVFTLLVQVGRSAEDGLPEGTTGAGLLCYASGIDEEEAVRRNRVGLETGRHGAVGGRGPRHRRRTRGRGPGDRARRTGSDGSCAQRQCGDRRADHAVRRLMDIFLDLDGTLTDNREGILRSIGHALAELGTSVPPEAELLSWIGPPLHRSFAAHLGDPALAERAVDAYRRRYREHGLFENRVYDGVPEMMVTLNSAGNRLFLATSKPAIFARADRHPFRVGRKIGRRFRLGA